MAHVVANSDCRQFTGGAIEFDLDVGTVREMIDVLEARYPGLGVFVDKRMAIAIDGEIHQDAWFAQLTAKSEVYLIPKIGGG